MYSGIRFILNRLGERLWVKPLLMCVVSVAAAFLASAADRFGIGPLVPDIAKGSIETLLTTISSSMMVIATLAVASMVSAYASASSGATPRSFSLVVSDDVSQNALSTFIGAFIYSIIALIALKNDYYGHGGRFALFGLTLLVFAIVIITFVRWVDRIARLGRMGSTIHKVEAATADALKRRKRAPGLGGVPVRRRENAGRPVYGEVGYVQRIDIAALQRYAESNRLRIGIEMLPGGFSAPGRPLAHVRAEGNGEFDPDRIREAFRIGDDRTFDEDPRFGLVVLSEIAGRALSPGVNDPGTAIDIIASLVRLFTGWARPLPEEQRQAPECDRIEVPELSLDDMFEDAFTAIARDGAGTYEVAVRLQKAFRSLADTGDPVMAEVAGAHARQALARMEKALQLQKELDAVRAIADSMPHS